MSTLRIATLCAAGLAALAACSKETVEESSGALADDDAADQAETGETPSAGAGAHDDDDDDAPASTSSSFVPDVGEDDAICDIWAQDCPADEKCMPWNSMGDTCDANKCVSVLGTGRIGDECTYHGSVQATDTCDVGLMCYYTNDDWVGVCVPLCSGTPEAPECPDGFNCSIVNDGALPLCVYACDPVLQDCQLEGTGCFWDGDKFNCDPAGSLLGNEPCGYINDCAPGFACLDAGSLPECLASACCTSFCDLGEPHCDMPETECIAFFDEGTAPPGLENTGVCALPGS